MKKIFNLIWIALLMSRPSYGQLTGKITQQVNHAYGTESKELHYVIDESSYISGGLTFNYPANWFSTMPCVTLTIQLLASYNSSTEYTASIETNSTGSTTIRVTKYDGTSLTEAANDEVQVNLYAIGSA